MYFETEPKSKKEDFFNYAFEYEQVKKALLRKDKIIAIIGVRRVGKTSLLNVIYHEMTKNLRIWLDGRIVSEPKKEIFAAIYETVKTGKPKIFGKIESLNVSAFGVGLGVKLGSESLNEMETAITSAGPVCVFIDEAQRMKRSELADVLSYCYDRFPNVSFILSGSEIGLVENVLGENDNEHPLYGRNVVKINMERLDKNRAMDFLKKGFEQIGVRITNEDTEKAINELDGLVGWLTLYGYERGIMKSKDALEKTTETAARIAASELVHFLDKTRNKKLYLAILRNVNGTSWTELRSMTGRELGTRLNPNSLTFALSRLTAYSFIERRNDKYYLSDPLLLKATFLV